MKKRILCMGLALLLLLSCVSCGKKDITVSDSGTVDTSETPSEVISVDEPEPDEPGPVLEENPRIAEIEAKALARKQELLAKPEELKKSDELILGKTYTGTAYYLSNKGNDDNDGLSAESPKASWESLNGKLKYGDAVLFECGSEWRVKFTQTGNINYDICRDQWDVPEGVTLSSYGDGERPVIRGDLAQEEAVNPDKWEIFYDENGKKIWHYTDKINKPNVIVFDNGSAEAEDVMNCLNGEGKLVNKEGKELSVDTVLEENLTYVHLTDPSMGTRWVPDPDNKWAMGDIYLRCDAGNPSVIYKEICIPQVEIGLNIKDVGAIENLNVCYFLYDGIALADYGNTTREDNVNNKVVENCILKYCGGGVSYSGPYMENVYQPHVSGGAMQISGRNISVHDNYFYSCGLFTLTLVAQYYSSEQGKKVIHDSIHVTDNYMENCGSSVHWANLTAKSGATCIFSDIVFSGNYSMYACGGRFQRAIDCCDANWYGFGAAVDNKFGSAENEDIKIENNVFFCSRQPLVSINAYRYTSDYIERCETSAVFSGNTYVQYSDTPFLLTNQDNNDPERNYTEWYRIYGKDYLKDFLGDDMGEYLEYPVYSEKDRAYLNGLVSYDIWLNDDNAEVSYTEYRNALIGLIQRVNPDKISYFEEKVIPIENDVSINRVMAFFMSFYAAHAMEIDYANVFGWSFRHEEAPFTTAENIFPTLGAELDTPIITKWNEKNTDADAAYQWLLCCGSPVTAHPIIDFDENGQFHDTDFFTNVDACNALTRLYEIQTKTRETSK